MVINSGYPGKHEGSSPTYTEIVRRLQQAYPAPRAPLFADSPLGLLLIVILLHQSDEETAVAAAHKVAAAFPTAEALANAPRLQIEALIRPIGFARQKAKAIQVSCCILVQRFDGAVPTSLPELVSLPGVGRKGAALLLHELGLGDGAILIDMHIARVAERLGLTRGRSIESVERQLSELAPAEQRVDLSHLLMTHGREVCTASKPACPTCPLQTLCPSARAAAPTADLRKPHLTRPLLRS